MLIYIKMHRMVAYVNYNCCGRIFDAFSLFNYFTPLQHLKHCQAYFCNFYALHCVLLCMLHTIFILHANKLIQFF